MKLTSIYFLVASFVNCYIPSVFAGECRGSFTVKQQDVITQDLRLHPAGPVSIKQFKRASAAEPYLIEVKAIKSGFNLLNQFQFKWIEDSWFILTKNGKQTSTQKNSHRYALRTNHKTLVRVNNQRFLVEVLSVETPVDRPNIATESERSIDVAIRRCL